MNRRLLPAKPPKKKGGFSLVEVLAAVTIIGVITFLAFPNLVRVKQDSEDSLARARADALNIAAAAYFQAAGNQAASAAWNAAADNQARYNLVAGYLAFAPATLSSYMPAGYSITFHSTQPHRIKATLAGPTSTNMAY